MEKDFARKLVKDALQHSFEKERFTYLVKNLLNKIEETPETVYRGNYIPDAYKDYISILERAGIQYVSVPELGNPFKDDTDWKPKYQLHLEQKGDLLCSRLYELKTPFCLLCAEKCVSSCHRKVISDYLADKGCEVEHLE